MMTRYLRSKKFLLDIIFLGLLTVISGAIISFYFPAENLNVSYPDWMVQAFRIQELNLHGMTSWTHTWSNGIQLWRSYQFLPQWFTLGIANLFAVDIPRAMVLVVIGQFIALRVVTYIVARLLHYSPFTALFAGIMTFSISYFWKAVGDYSLLFAFSIFPLMIFLWVKYMQGKMRWLYPYLAGLMFYVHPILGITSISLWAVSKFFEGSQVFSRQSFIQFFLFLLSSGLFWAPIVFKTSYTNSTAYLATKEFLQLSLNPFSYFGLSLFLLIVFFIGFIHQFFPVQRKYRWSKILFLFVVLFFGLIYIGTHISLPAIINQFQYTRGIGLIGIGIIFAVLPLIEYVQLKKSLFIKGLLVATLTIFFTEGLWITSSYSPNILKQTADPVSTFVTKNNIDASDIRIWTPTIELSSYYGAEKGLKYPTSYMAHLESNHLPERLQQLITYRPLFSQIPAVELKRVNDYLKLAGVKYVFFEEGSPFIPLLKDKNSGYIYKGRIVIASGVYEAFETPWEISNAVLISDVIKNNLTPFPTNMKFNKVTDQIALDEKVKNFNQTLADPVNQTLMATYPTEESVTISIPSNRTSNTIVLNESYDKEWKAYFKGIEQKIQPVGPNFMMITLDNNQKEGTLILNHSWPLYYYFFIFAIPVIPIWLLISSKIFGIKKMM